MKATLSIFAFDADGRSHGIGRSEADFDLDECGDAVTEFGCAIFDSILPRLRDGSPDDHYELTLEIER